MYTLKTKLHQVKGIGPKLSEELATHELFTVKDIILLLPLRYEDRSKLVTISSIPDDELITFQATITSASQFYKNKKSIQSARAKDETGSIKLMWFNNKFIMSKIRNGGEFLISGKKGKNNTMIQPVVENVKAETLHTNRLVPLYSSTIAIKQGSIRHILKEILDNLEIKNDELDLLLSSRQKAIGSSSEPLSLVKVTKELHFPDNQEMIEIARERLVLEEFLCLMKISAQLKSFWHAKSDAIPIRQQALSNSQSYTSNHKPSWLPKTIPFQLTGAQIRVTEEILRDIAKPIPMNRIVIGDVGSGKTVVAGIASQQVLLNGYSAAFIAPTKILAEQHMATIQKLFPEMRVELVTSGQRPKGKAENKSTIANPLDATLYVGTHAILNRLSEIKPALIVYDEQHRFGVSHRSLSQELHYSPHILTMTATPIPRSMMLTLFSHLQLSAIDELPPGRIPPKTWLVSEKKRAGAYEWINDQLESNNDQQIIIVCPFIDPSEAEALENVAAATQTFETIRSVFPKQTVELLHGRLAKKAQSEIITSLFAQKIQILVTTPIVEVGVDLPQASIIIIEAAERFGLASLHQLRGRVGRAGQESYCMLFTNSHTKTVTDRLKAFCGETNGLKLAELDLQNRGAGDIFGIQQSGFTGLQYGSWSNLALISQAQDLFPQLSAHWQPTLVRMPEFEEVVPYAN